MGRAIPMNFGGLSNPGDDLGARPYEAVTWPEAEPIPDVGVPGGLTGPGGLYPKNVDAEPPEEPEPVEELSGEANPLEGETSEGEDEMPWDKMTTHAALDTFIDGPDGYPRPDDWSAKTIAQKKEWLDNA